MKSINNEKLKSREKSGDTSRKSGIVTKTLVALSTAFALGQQPAKADMITPTPMNLMTSPVYSFFSGNIYHNFLWDDENIKDPNAKEVIKKTKGILLEFNINNKLALQDFLGLISKLHQNKINTIDFIELFMKLGKKYNLSSDNTIRLLSEFNNKNFMPKNFSNDLKKYINTNFTELYSFYGDKTDDKLNRIIELYNKNGTLSESDIKKVMPELLERNKKVDFLLNIMISVLISVLILGGFNIYKES